MHWNLPTNATPKPVMQKKYSWKYEHFYQQKQSFSQQDLTKMDPCCCLVQARRSGRWQTRGAVRKDPDWYKKLWTADGPVRLCHGLQITAAATSIYRSQMMVTEEKNSIDQWTPMNMSVSHQYQKTPIIKARPSLDLNQKGHTQTADHISCYSMDLQF